LDPPEWASTSKSLASRSALAMAVPPPGQVVDGDVGGVVGHAHRHAGFVDADVLDAVGQGDLRSVGGEVVVEHQRRLLSPGRPGVLKVPDQLAVLDIYAHDGQAGLGEDLPPVGDVGQLGVAPGVVLLVELLRVRPQPVTKS
jgi:hypothetical protein